MNPTPESDLPALPEAPETLVRPAEGAPLTEDERLELLVTVLRSGNMPRRGRPKKGSGQPKWSDFGFTRQFVYECRRMAEIPQDDFEAWQTERERQGKNPSTRALFIHFGKRNVYSEDIFEGTPTGDLAHALLKPVERVFRFGELTKHQRRALLHALRFRLKCIADMAKLESDEPQGKG
jgi:hypothetical protein